MKSIKSMSEREIMEEILKRERKASVFRLIVLVFIIALIAAAIWFVVVIVPQIIQSYNEYLATMEQVNKYLAELDEMDIDGLQELVNSMQSTLETIDFEKLKNTINSLQSAIESIGKILGF